MIGNTHGSSSNEGDSVYEAAAAFHVHRQSGHWTPADQAELDLWLDSPVHAEAYRRVQRAWNLMDRHQDAKVLQPIRGAARQRLGKGAVEADRETPSRVWRAWAAALVLAAGLGVTGYLYLFSATTAVYATTVGQNSKIELDDGSTVWLDGRSRVTVHLTRDARTVELMEGQAQFSVAPDEQRPFRVSAGEHDITALGTIFNVELVGQRVDIAMLEGKVRVSPRRVSGSAGNGPSGSGSSAVERTPSLELHAGQGVTIREGTLPALPAVVDVDAVVAWQQGKIVFKEEALGDAVRRLGRYSDVSVEINDPGLAGLQVNGVFESGDIMAFVQAVQSYWPDVTAVRAEGGSIQLSRE